MIFTLTTPGFTDMANSPRFVSKWFDNMRSTYGMGEYVWVREFTKKGFPHFHCVADWHNTDWFFSQVDGMSMISKLSQSWSSYFGSQAVNSVWLGGYWYGKRIYKLRSRAQSRYLCKYIGKTFGMNQYAKPVSFPGGIVPLNGSDKPRGRLRSVNNSESIALPFFLNPE